MKRIASLFAGEAARSARRQQPALRKAAIPVMLSLLPVSCSLAADAPQVDVQKLMACVKEHLPKGAIDQGITVTTRARVAVDKDGKVLDVAITLSAGPTRVLRQIDRATERVVRCVQPFKSADEPYTFDFTHTWQL